MKRLAILLLPLLVALLPAAGNGSAANRAGVVIRYADGSVRTSCVSFDQSSISGLELLQRADNEVIMQPAPGNAAVCKIDGDGCDYPAEPCFCTFGAGGSGKYWAYWQLDGATWRYGQQGAGARRVGDGDVDGWAYGSGSAESSVQPPVVTFAEVCPLASSLEPTQPATLDPVASTAGSPGAVASAALPGERPSPPPVAGAASLPAEPDQPQPSVGWGSYAVFAIMLAGILGAIAVAVRRRGAT